MKLLMLLLAFVSLTTLGHAATTVTVDDEQVTVNSPATVTTRDVLVPVAVTPVVVTTTEPSDHSSDWEGEIVSIDYPQNEIVVRNATPSEKRIKGDPGIVSTLKVGDHVRVDLRGTGNENIAHRIIEI